MRKYKHLIRHALILTVSVCVLMSTAVSFAATDTKSKQTDQKTTTADISGEVTQSYNADKNVQVGMVVKLKEDKSKTVVPLTTKESKIGRAHV